MEATVGVETTVPMCMRGEEEDNDVSSVYLNYCLRSRRGDPNVVC